jgi:chondroitin AC lyase
MFLSPFLLPIEAKSTDNIELIIGRIQVSQKVVNIESVEQETRDCIVQLQEGGALPSIDYKNRLQTNWEPLEHLDKLKSIVLAYTMDGSKYTGDARVYNVIEKMLQYWYDADPTSTNWYMQQIAVPQRIGIILILMRSGAQALPAQLENQLIERMEKTGGRPDQSGSPGTAANKIDIATHWIYRGCLLNDDAILSFGVQQAFSPLTLTTDEGLQHDFSYQQHGPQLYIGGYGDVLAGGIARLALYMTGTPYALPREKLELLSNFVRKSYIPVTRGQYFLYNVIGRGLSRKNALNNVSSVGLMQQIMKFDPANKQSYEDAASRLKGEKNPSYGIQPENIHFWRSDYTLHQRPAYTFDVRMASIHTSRSENGNGENLRGYFLTDGATSLTLQGDEYDDIFPVWDWARIPGVTNPIVGDIPLPRPWQTPGTSKFAGGVSNGRYGVSAYFLDDNNFGVNTSARKAWFFFDEEVVCLGAGISSIAPQPINTTVNQCLLKGDVIACIDGQETMVNGALESQNDLSWVLHNGTCYYFPEKGNISISNQMQKGTWKSINTSLSGDTVQKEVFKLWFDHGLSPRNEKYSYIIVPDKGTIAELKKYTADDVSILSNTDSIQAVAHRKLNICGIIFYKAGTFSDSKYSITTDKPCIILLDYNSESEIKFHLADPSRIESNIKLKLKERSSGYQQEIECKLPVTPDPYAGASALYTINRLL